MAFLTLLPSFYLYTTLGCHLCDEAELVIDDLRSQMFEHFALSDGAAVKQQEFFIVTRFDIASDDRLIERYGTRIPVLLSEDKKQELDWPFDVQSLYEFMSDCLKNDSQIV